MCSGSGNTVEDLFSATSPGLLRLITALLSERRSFEVKDLDVRLASGRRNNMDAYGSVLERERPVSRRARGFDGAGVTGRVADSAGAERDHRAVRRRTRARSEQLARGHRRHRAGRRRRRRRGSGDAASDFVAIIEEAERGASLARSLRAIAFDETGGWRPVSLAAEIRAAATVLARGSSAVRIDLDLANAVSDVVGDRARLHQLVLNLLVNARDATVQGEGSIEVRLGPTAEGGVEFVVADHGPGVPVELRERIFQPYFTTKRRPGDGESGPGWGTGLGLAIVDAVARATGATVSVGDRAGGGAEFRVSWPPTAVFPEPTDRQGEPSSNVSPALVLLADNEVALVGAVARQLRRLGHSVYAAMSAEECRRLFEQYRDTIDVAVLDVKLGDGDGRELAEFFRGQRPDLAIVLMSARPCGPRATGSKWLDRS